MDGDEVKAAGRGAAARKQARNAPDGGWDDRLAAHFPSKEDVWCHVYVLPKTRKADMDNLLQGINS